MTEQTWNSYIFSVEKLSVVTNLNELPSLFGPRSKAGKSAGTVPGQ
jgi:hypothetical protein